MLEWFTMPHESTMPCPIATFDMLQAALHAEAFWQETFIFPACGVGAEGEIEKLLCRGFAPGIVWAGFSIAPVMFVAQLSVGQRIGAPAREQLARAHAQSPGVNVLEWLKI